jgi:hypothetical protein
MPAVTTGLTASECMERAASFLNDTGQQVYTNTTLLPYLKTAWDELQVEFELNNLQITNMSSAIAPIQVDVGTIQISPPGGAVPNYPGDLIEIQQLADRSYGTEDQFFPMKQFEFLSQIDDLAPQAFFNAWVFEDNIIKLNPMGCSSVREIRIQYIKEITVIEDEDTVLGVINGINFLAFRTAALVAELIKRDKESADALNGNAGIALQSVVGINVKGKQSISTRKRPFRASYRNRGIV